MTNYLKVMGISILVILSLGILTFVGHGVATGNYIFWAPIQQKAEYKVFTNSPAYIQGFNRSLAFDFQQYQLANDSDKKLMKGVIQVKYGKYKTSDVEDETLRNWLIGIRGY